MVTIEIEIGSWILDVGRVYPMTRHMIYQENRTHYFEHGRHQQDPIPYGPGVPAGAIGVPQRVLPCGCLDTCPTQVETRRSSVAMVMQPVLMPAHPTHIEPMYVMQCGTIYYGSMNPVVQAPMIPQATYYASAQAMPVSSTRGPLQAYGTYQQALTAGPWQSSVAAPFNPRRI